MDANSVAKPTTEELLETAVGNWNGLLFASIDFLKENKIPLSAYVQHVGKRFAPFWGTGLNAFLEAGGYKAG